jgi:multiple sugar transport system substrate-binding protein
MKKLLVFVLVLLLLLGVGISTVAASKPSLKVWGRASFVAAVNEWVGRKVEEFAEERDINVEWSLLPSDQLTTKMFAAIQAGNPPDVVIHGYPAGQFAEKGMLLPLDDVVDSLGRDDIFENKIRQYTIGEHVYAIPTQYELYWLHLRKDKLDEKGLDVPYTIQEYLDVSAALTDEKNSFYGTVIAEGRDYDANVHFQTFLYAMGGGVMSSRSVQGVDAFNNEITVAALEYLKDLYESGAAMPRTVAPGSGNNTAYTQGLTASTMNPPSILYSLVEGGSPLADPSKTILVDLEVLMDQGEECCFAFTTTDYPDLAKDLIQHIFEDKEEYRRNFIEASQLYGLPIFKSQAKIIGDQWEAGKWKNYFRNPYKVLTGGTVFVSCPTLYPLDEAVGLGDIMNTSWVYSDMMSMVLQEELSPKEAVERTHKRMQELARELGYPEYPEN